MKLQRSCSGKSRDMCGSYGFANVKTFPMLTFTICSLRKDEAAPSPTNAGVDILKKKEKSVKALARRDTESE